MRRNKFRLLEELSGLDGNVEAAYWPELQAARLPANDQDLGLWRLAEDSARLARPRSTIVRLQPRTEPRFPDFPDAA